MFSRGNHCLGAFRTSVLLGAVAIVGNAAAQSGISPGPPQPSEDGQEILTRGPVHEAFAEPVAFDHQQGVVVPKEPPQQVEELPPVEKPEGDVIWIPGYWNWDDERQDFIWVSGIWRNAPPNMRWIPGYWNRVGNGYQWTSGFWQNATEENVEYLPQPPASLENGAPTPQPSENHFWVPGNWAWTSNRYAWRAGYWSVSQPDWIWHPASYYWTPSGYAFVNGYWDYPLANRGLLFAPAYFSSSYLVRRPVYTPTVVIQTPGLMLNFFARPRYRHYYFGDYYAAPYVERGYRPWFRYDRVSYRYDPLYTYYHVHYGRSDRMWRSRMVDRYDRLVVDANLRPPRTYAAQQIAIAAMPRRGGTRVDVGLALASPVSQVAVGGSVRFEKMSQAQRVQTAAVAAQVNQFRDQRVRLEGAPNLARVNGVPGSQPKTVRLTGSPIVDPGVRVTGTKPIAGRAGEKGTVGGANASTQPRRGDNAPGRETKGGIGRPGVAAGSGPGTPSGKVGRIGDPSTVKRQGDGGLGNPNMPATKTGAVSKPAGQPSAVRIQPGGPQNPGAKVQPGMTPPNAIRPQPGSGRPERRTPPSPPKSNEKGRANAGEPAQRLAPAITHGLGASTGLRTGNRDGASGASRIESSGSRDAAARGRTYSSGESRPGGSAPNNLSRRSSESSGGRNGRSPANDSRSRPAPSRGERDKDRKGSSSGG